MGSIRFLLPGILQQRRLFIAAMIFAVISAGGLMTGLLSLGPMLRIILDGDKGQNVATLIEEYNQSQPLFEVPGFVLDLLPSDPFNAVLVIMSGIAVLTIIGGTANFLHQFFSLELATRAVASIRERVFRHVLEMRLVDIQSRGAAELISRINKDSFTLQGGYLSLTSKGIAQTTKGFAAFLAAIVFDWRLTVVAVVVAPILASILRKVGRRIRVATRGALEAQEDLLRVSNESVQGIRTLKTASGEDMATERFAEANSRVLKEELRVRTARAISSPLIEMLAVYVLIGLAILAAWQILDGKLDIDSFILSLTALGVAGGSLRPLTSIANDIQAAAAPAERLEAIAAEPSEFADTVDNPPLARHHERVCFEDVSYRYPGAADDALKGVSLDVPAGQHVAIVGPNGCGKTTLLAMLPRLLTPSSGRVLIDGKDLGEVRLDSLRDQIGVVTQEAFLIRGTIAENIAFGRPPDAVQLKEAASRAHAIEFIERLPQGFDTEVAELGTSLSGGQRQRIAIARALYRDPAILVLDEATSQIDSESEQQINEAIAEFGRGRTALVIAHRLSTVLAADWIVVMDEGRVIDSGVHDELLGRCPAYQRLARTQLVES
ncbi:MAG: ABC transporter ATP-binding protein/permease [Phycisphaerales bacterium]|nr:ABC transporter ATP-binding protein/permease [Phycisphaerales bacterium]